MCFSVQRLSVDCRDRCAWYPPPSLKTNITGRPVKNSSNSRTTFENENCLRSSSAVCSSDPLITVSPAFPFSHESRQSWKDFTRASRGRGPSRPSPGGDRWKEYTARVALGRDGLAWVPLRGRCPGHPVGFFTDRTQVHVQIIFSARSVLLRLPLLILASCRAGRLSAPVRILSRPGRAIGHLVRTVSRIAPPSFSFRLDAVGF